MEETEKQEKKSGYSFWSPTEEELEKQVKEYSTLSIFESYRGIALLVVLATLLITFLLAHYTTAIDDLGGMWSLYYSLALYIPLGLLTFWGQRWSMVILFILWTADKAIIVFQLGGIGAIAFWYILAHILWKAYLVEGARKKIPESDVEGTETITKAKDYKLFKTLGAISLGVVIFFAAALTDPRLEEGRIEHGTSRELNIQVGGGVQYESDLHNFSVWFPEHPGYQTQTGQVPDTDLSIKLHMYGALDENGSQYMVVLTGVPGLTTGTTTDEELDLIVEGALGNMPATELIKKEYINHNGYRGVTMVTTDSVTGYNGRWLTIPYEKESASLMILSKEEVSEKQFNDFMESFTYGK